MWLHITSAFLVCSLVGLAFDSVLFFTAYYPVNAVFNNVISCNNCSFIQGTRCHDTIHVNVSYIFNNVEYTRNTTTTDKLCGSPCCQRLALGSNVTVKIDPLENAGEPHFMWNNDTIISTFYSSVCLAILFGSVFFISLFLVLVDIVICFYHKHKNHRYQLV